MGTPGAQEQYVLEGNEGELQRLADQHDVLKASMGTLVLAPVDFSNHLRILDSGTADGLWLRELQESLDTSHTYVGTDINAAFFPEDHPGVSLQVQSITQDWPREWASSFDYVHQRLTLVGAGQTPVKDCVAKLVNLIKAGGWIELIEADFTGESPNGPAMQKYETLLRTFFDITGVGSDFSKSLKGYLEDEGLQDVQEMVFSIPYGNACHDATLAEKGSSHLLSALKGVWDFLHGNTSTSLDAEFRVLRDEVERELEYRGAHVKMVAVWARQPVRS
ncbi:S-adenosyl-L-methionine-dependent methyltransferase [Daldinia decipiens]|uniref:S-adenosyl-L-methionine-dependent methyltransferase n=1 Tax=Daldinia decipiens TaxID=326647 RepID=UPI0020C31D6D|nr:S-adenosyl-L-methionine-dependent methyltransferase [Daldinia decipiens]KAI1653950.1 S-adenosyl-L-methionine-dependent methyltransferase [Daldinia decipiens]